MQAPKLPFKLPTVHMGPRMRRVVRYVGLALFAVVVFVFALQMTFPYDRAKEKLVEALSEKYEVTIGSVERGWMPGRVYFKAFSIRTRATKAEEVVTTFYIEKLEVDLGVLALIGGTIAVDVDAKIGAGQLIGSVEVGSFGRGDIKASFEGNSLPGANLPMRGLLGLPLTGKIEFDVDLHLPMEKSKMGKTSINWQKASGNLALSCPSGCTFGDGKTKLKPLLKNTRNQAMVGEGIDFGKVSMDTLAAKVSIKKGKLSLDKFDTTSKDGQLKMDFQMTLEKEFSESMVAGCLRFKGSDDLLRREPKTHAAISTTGAELRGDGLFHIRLTDRFKDMKRLNAECGPGTQINNAENFDSARPKLTVTPDEAARPTPMPAVPSPTPTPVEEPPPPPPATPPTTGSAAAPGSAAPGSAAPGSAAPLPPATPEGREGGGGTRDHQGGAAAPGSATDPTGAQPMPPPEQ